MGSTIIPASLLFTLRTISACCSAGWFLWMTVIPPSRAKAIARDVSDTVSMAALSRVRRMQGGTYLVLLPGAGASHGKDSGTVPAEVRYMDLPGTGTISIFCYLHETRAVIWLRVNPITAGKEARETLRALCPERKVS